MFAVVRFGSKQYRVVPGEAIEIERLNIVELNQKFEVADVLLVAKDDNTVIVDPVSLLKFKVVGTVIKEYKDDKVIVFKKKRRKGYTKKRGHRQQKMIFRVDEIVSN